MPCHVDAIPPRIAKKEVNMVIEVVNGSIAFKEVGDSFSGKYPTITTCIRRFRKTSRKRTFHWLTFGAMIVFVSPCPKGC